MIGKKKATNIQATQEILQIKEVTFHAICDDIFNLEADIVVQPSGTSRQGDGTHVSPWVIRADQEGAISRELSKHRPFSLGDVIITSTGTLNMKYLFSAVVLDWRNAKSQDSLLSDEIVSDAAYKCIELAVALGQKSIAFTPWGTRVGATEASRITAIMIQAISSALQTNAGQLESIYLISHDKEHFQWFVDRAFVFEIMFNQFHQMKEKIDDLNLANNDREQILGILDNLKNNVVIYNEVVSGDKISVGNISGAHGIAIGKESQANLK